MGRHPHIDSNPFERGIIDRIDRQRAKKREAQQPEGPEGRSSHDGRSGARVYRASAESLA